MTRLYFRLVTASTGTAALVAVAGVANGCGPINCTETATCPDPADVVQSSNDVVASDDVGDARQGAVEASEGVADAHWADILASEGAAEASDAVGPGDAIAESSPVDSRLQDTRSPQDSSAADMAVADADGGREAASSNDAGPLSDAGLKCGSSVLTPSGAVSSPLAMSAAGLAIDGNLSTRWESVHAVDPQWIYLDFGAPIFVNRVRILWETACATNYDLQVSNDAIAWTTMRSIAGNTQGGTPPTDWTTAVDHQGLVGGGRYMRVNGTARCTSYGYSIWEMQVFGDINASCHP